VGVLPGIRKPHSGVCSHGFSIFAGLPRAEQRNKDGFARIVLVLNSIRFLQCITYTVVDISNWRVANANFADHRSHMEDLHDHLAHAIRVYTEVGSLDKAKKAFQRLTKMDPGRARELVAFDDDIRRALA
jgi:hypothetical protein